MKVGILGSGIVGQNIGAVLAKQGHEVVLGTRTPEKLDERRGIAGQSLVEWMNQAGGGGRVGTFEQAAKHGEVVINAANGEAAIEVLRTAGQQNLDGKILIDITNPLDFSKGMPPTLFVCNDDSLAERIQRELPGTKVVKTLSTVNTFIMTDPAQLGGGDHSIFVSGNDVDAKRQVTGWLQEWFGWRDVIDLGDITTARGVEMLLPLWVRLWTALGTPAFNLKVVR